MDVEQAPAKSNPKFRGKLYSLTEDSQWLDAGTGFASVQGTGGDRRLVFRDEESSEVLHDRPVFGGADIYQLQGEGDRQTIIVWEDQEDQKDWALSFQDSDGTVEVYELLLAADPKVPEVKRFLPFPNVSNLQELKNKLQFVPPSQRDIIAHECLHPEFLKNLRETFASMEDLNSENELVYIWYIVKGMFLLSQQKLTERLLKDDIYEEVLGMLELDESLPVDKRIPHRQVIKSKVTFKEVLQFEDAEILERIHINYRLSYLKDIVLPRTLDDASFASLVQMTHTNLMVILDYLQKSKNLMERLIGQIRQEDEQSLLFLQDACRLAKQIPPMKRQVLYDRMAEFGLFDALEVFFRSNGDGSQATARSDVAKEHSARHHAVEVLMLHAQHDPSHLRNFLTREGNESGHVVLVALIQLMLHEEDQGVQSQIMEILRAVMDPTSLEHRERDGRLDVFYDHGAIDELVSPLNPQCDPDKNLQALFAKQLVCELVAFAISRHGYRAKVYVIRHGLAQQASRLLSAPQRYLQLAAVRVLRAIVGTKDEAYHRYLMKAGVFTPLMKSFEQCLLPPALGSGLMVSAVLELFDFIRAENLKLLVEHLCEGHQQTLQKYASKLKTVEQLLLKHQQNLEYEQFPPDQHAAGGPVDGIGSSTSGSRTRRMRSPGREESSEDDSYFESLDDEGDEDNFASPSPSRNLPVGQQSAGSTPGKAGLQGLLGGYQDEEEDQEAGQEPPAKGSEEPEAEPSATDASSGQDGSEAAAANLANNTEEKSNEAASDVAGSTEANPEATSGNLGHVSKRPRTSESPDTPATGA
eukprot:TRINITY_DN31962_c0_g1_i1.p1 TRINITY_DN31962_c0_g1~~TRINITY_DN31962_c0_g1_i1.p1  ORF type:complete len:811 (-),score=159.56 TRINITY_DN31962_c0_g1_i1:152-2584(-)